MQLPDWSDLFICIKKMGKIDVRKNKMLQIHPVKLAVGVNGCIMNRVQKIFLMKRIFTWIPNGL